MLLWLHRAWENLKQVPRWLYTVFGTLVVAIVLFAERSMRNAEEADKARWLADHEAELKRNRNELKTVEERVRAQVDFDRALAQVASTEETIESMSDEQLADAITEAMKDT